MLRERGASLWGLCLRPLKSRCEGLLYAASQWHSGCYLGLLRWPRRRKCIAEELEIDTEDPILATYTPLNLLLCLAAGCSPTATNIVGDAAAVRC